jgi:hypothetical protein
MSFGKVGGFELDRRDVAEGLVQTVVVKPADVLDDPELELRSGAPHTVGDQLGLEAVEEALGHRVRLRLRLRLMVLLGRELSV